MIIGMHRPTFPNGPASETPEERRIRWEQWLIETREQLSRTSDDQNHLDPEYDAVMSQPSYSHTTRPSAKKAVRAACWQCVSGNGDEGGRGRIAACACTDCPLWSVRPYQGDEKVPRRKIADIDKTGINPRDYKAVALANPGNLSFAVKGYCLDCCIGQISEVRACTTVTCGLWLVRPGAKNGDSGDHEQNAYGDRGE